MTSKQDRMQLNVQRLKIDHYRILQDLDLQFYLAENGENIVHLLAGVNGCGKSTFLSLLYDIFSGNCPQLSDSGVVVTLGNGVKLSQPDEKNYFIYEPVNFFDGAGAHISDFASFYSRNNHYENGQDSSPKVIYFPAFIDLGYQKQTVLESDYQFQNTIERGSILGKAEYFIREFILSRERKSYDKKPEKREQEAVDRFNQYFEKTDFVTRLVGLDPRMNRPQFRAITGETVFIDQLSDGEKQLYGRVVALIMLNPKNSLILIDEPEISLHPKWQQTIMQIYANIGSGNQFIVATHSPQIIANTPWQNIIAMVKSDGKIIAYPVSSPPTGIDINSLLVEVMGAEDIPRSGHLDLYRIYRKHIEQHTEESEDAVKVLNNILQYESQDSVFLQEMNLLKSLRNRV